MLGAMFEEILNLFRDHRGEVSEIHKVVTLLQEGNVYIMAKYDKLESDLADLAAAVAAVKAPAEDDSDKVAELELRVEKLTADLKAKEDGATASVPDPNATPVISAS